MSLPLPQTLVRALSNRRQQKIHHPPLSGLHLDARGHPWGQPHSLAVNIHLRLVEPYARGVHETEPLVLDRIVTEVLQLTGSGTAVVAGDGTVIEAAASRNRLMRAEALTHATEAARAAAAAAPDSAPCAAKLGRLQQAQEVLEQRRAERRRRGKDPETLQYPKSRFHYDAAADCYYCPNAQRPTPVGRDHGSATRTGYVLYATSACEGCALRAQCTRSRTGRRIKRYAIDTDKDALRAKMADPEVRRRYRRRQAMVEPVFSQLRHTQGLQRFRRRGLRAVRSSLPCTRWPTTSAALWHAEAFCAPYCHGGAIQDARATPR